MSLPPLPDGATLDEQDSGPPPLPDGATLDQPGHTTYDPTEGMSTSDKFLAGAGKGLVDTGRGVYQLGASIGHAAGLVSDEKMAKIQADIDESHELDKPLMHTTAGKVGDVVGTAAPALLVPGGGGILSGAAAGAAMGAAQPVATGESRLQNAGMGAVGGGAGGAVAKLLKGLGGFGIPLSRENAVNTLLGEKIPLSVAQKTGAKTAQHIERASGALSDSQNEFVAQQSPAFNRAVLRRIGVNDPNVSAATPDVLFDAKKAITGVMDDVASRGVDVDDTMLNHLGDVEENALRKLPEADMGPIKAHISDILSNSAKNGGSLDGTAYQKIRTSLGDLSTDPRYAPIAHDMQDVLDDALTRSAPQDAARLGAARVQYRALKQIEPAVDSGGNISVPKLMTSLMNKSNRNQTLYGQGDQSLVNLAKAARQIIPDSLGNSGTAERLIGPLTVMEIARSGEIPKAAMKAGAALYGGALAGKAMRSQGTLGNIAAKGVPGVGKAARVLQTPISTPLGTVTPSAITRKIPQATGIGAAESTDRDIDQDQIQRAAGGRVDTDVLVNKLMNRWKNAKKETNESTKPFLRLHDTAIAKALEIAGDAI